MEKAMTFSDKQKGLIWDRFVAPTGGTQEEAEHFIEVCEQFGLNPLTGDIVFQRYNTKQGPKTQFITTRDGLLRVAHTQPGYVGAPNANVVRQGDHFQMNPTTGEVDHRFGQERGKIEGAYAVMNHKTFNPVAVYVDFEEYFNANAGTLNTRNGYPNVWDKMPSAMIIKIAEVFVLRRQFPLGGLYTREEMSLENEEFAGGDTKPNNQPNQNNQQQSKPEQNDKPKVEYLTKEQVEKLEQKAQEIASIGNVKVEDILKTLGKPLEEIPAKEYNNINEILGTLKNRAENQKKKEQEPQQQEQGQEGTVLNLVKKEVGVSRNGTKFIKLFVKEYKNPVFAKTEEAINDARSIQDNTSFTANLGQEGSFVTFEGLVNISKSA